MTSTFDKDGTSPRSFRVHLKANGVYGGGNIDHVKGHGSSYSGRGFTIQNGRYHNDTGVLTFDIVYDDGSPTEHFKGDVYGGNMQCTIKVKDPGQLVEPGTGAQYSDYADYRAKVTLH